MLTPEEKTIVRSAKVHYSLLLAFFTMIFGGILVGYFTKPTGMIITCILFTIFAIFIYRMSPDKILKRFKHNARVAGYTLKEAFKDIK